MNKVHGKEMENTIFFEEVVVQRVEIEAAEILSYTKLCYKKLPEKTTRL